VGSHKAGNESILYMFSLEEAMAAFTLSLLTLFIGLLTAS